MTASTNPTPKKKATKKKTSTAEKKETKEKKSSTANVVSPFTIIQMMFNNEAEFKKLTNFTLERNFFMINRTYAIAYPLHAQFFNNLKIPCAAAIKGIKCHLNSIHGWGRVPSFVYTKGSKATSEKIKAVSVLKDFSNEELNSYCSHYNISLRDLKDMETFTPDSLVEHINNFVNTQRQSYFFEK